MRKYKILKMNVTGEATLCAECDSIEFATTAADKLAQELKDNKEYDKVLIKELKNDKYKGVGEIYIEQNKENK